MEEIDLKEVFEVFWNKKTTIILVTAIFMVLGFIYTSFILVPKYSSSTTLVLVQASTGKGENLGITASDINLNSKLISTYSKLVESSSVIRPAISNLGIEETEAEIKKNLSVEIETDTEMMKIIVTDEEPVKAAKIANEIADVFIEQMNEVYKIENIYRVDPAEVPNEPSNVNHIKDIIIFGMIGFVIVAGYIFVIFMLDNSIKSQDDVEKITHVPVLANIPVYEIETNEKSKTRKTKRSNGGKRKWEMS